MTLLDAVVSWLVQHGPTLLLGATVVLAAGCVALLASRSLEQRRRLGVLTALGTSLYLVLGAVPLPRLAWPESGANESPRGDTAPAPPMSSFVDPALRAAALERALADLQADTTATSPPDLTSSSTPLPAVAEPALAEPVPAEPIEAQPAAAEPAFAWSTLLASTWLLGALFFLVRHLVGTTRLRRLLAACTEAAPTAVPSFAMPPGTRLLLSPHRVRPFCAGLVRPVIVLPDELMQPDRLAEARAVLAHEASHLRAGDSRVATLLAWLAIPLFCHPLYWWLCREVRFCNELLADDDAAGPDRNSYARALLDLAEHDQPALAACGSVAVFHRPSEFYRRIQMLLQRRGSLSSRTSRLCRATSAFAALCLVGTVAGLFGTPVAAQEPGERARKEVELRETIAALRAEIQELRALLQTKQGVDFAEAQRFADHLGTRLPDAKSWESANPLLRDPKQRQPKDSESIDRLNRAMRGNRPAMGGNRFYDVEKGDTLERIALRQLGNESLQEEVKRLNPNVDWDELRVGERLLLPNFNADIDATLRWLGHHQDKPGDAWTPLSGSQRFGDEWGRLARTAKPDGNLPAGAPATATGDLTSRYLDLQAEIEIAEATAAESKQLAERGLASSLDARKAAVNLRTLQKKFGIVRRLLDGEIDATEAEIDWLSRRIEATDAADRDPIMIQRDRARARLEAMRAVK
ncbi:MAG TPA: M56 family metallopeptidase, partial [Planctomycetota bacterium]|nr:M56 family metallopeptidase [Planctomycetota bacterium]